MATVDKESLIQIRQSAFRIFFNLRNVHESYQPNAVVTAQYVTYVAHSLIKYLLFQFHRLESESADLLQVMFCHLVPALKKKHSVTQN